jgi:peroxiredoxin
MKRSACLIGTLSCFIFASLPSRGESVAPATPEAAAEWARTLPESSRFQTLWGILGAWAASQPTEAANWWKKQPSDENQYGGDSIFQTWAKKDPKGALDWIGSSLSDERAASALNGVASGWVELDPLAAAKWAYGLSEERDFIVSNVIQQWAGGWGGQNNNSSAAKDWCQKLPVGKKKLTALEALGQSWGHRHQREALQWMESLAKPEEKAAFIKGIARTFGWNGAEAGIAWSDTIQDPQLKKVATMGVVESWGQSSPDEAEKWIAALPEGEMKKSLQEGFQQNKSTCGMPVARARVRAIPTPPDLQKILDAPLNQARQDALAKYLVEWFEKDREKATSWISAKLKGYVLGVNAGMVAREWSKKDLPAAAEWVRQIPPFFRDFVARVGAEWAADRPKEVAEAVLKWPDDSRRDVVMRGVCEAWAQKDPAAALKWVEALPRGETRTGALKGLVIGWSQTDATACRGWADKITNEEDQKEARHYIIHGLALSKPQEATAYLKSFPDGESDRNLIYCLGKEWALVDAPAAAEWAKSLPAGEKQECGLQAVLRQWVYADAVRSADWAEKIPEKQSRSLALKSVMENWVEQNPREALAWTQQIKDSEGQLEALTLALGIWGQSNRQEALDWSNKLPDGKQKDAIRAQLTPIRRRLVREEKVKVGQEAPLFEVKTVDGKEIKLADFKGKYVLLDFWATWCGPCVGETPNLKAVFEKYGKREDFAMIGLSLDKEVEKPKAYAKQNGCEWVDGFLGDWGKDEVTKKYGVSGIPSIWLIGPDGKVVASRLRGNGIMEAVSSALEQKK